MASMHVEDKGYHIDTYHRIYHLLVAVVLQTLGLSLAIPIAYLLYHKGCWYWALVVIPVGLYIFWFGFRWTGPREAGAGRETREGDNTSSN